MNRKSRIIVSVVGITIVLLALLGLTYGYYLTRIQGNTNTNSISVTTENLELIYNESNGYIIGDGEIIEPGKTFTTKAFTVTNNGNADIDNYAVILEDVKTYYNQAFTDENNNPIEAGTQVAFARPEDFEIAISCKITTSETREGNDCDGYTGTLPLMESVDKTETYITNGILLTNSIKEGETHTYSVTLTYKEANVDQSADMNKVLTGKFNVIDVNNTIDITGIVSGYSAGDTIVTNSIRRESQINSDGSYKIVGLDNTIHSIKKKSKNTESQISKLSIIKGEKASVGTTIYNGSTIDQLTITNNSRVATIDINASSNTLTINNLIRDFGKENVNLITFSISGDFYEAEDGTYIEGPNTYYAEEGMTWAEWVDSSYNTFIFISDGWQIYFDTAQKNVQMVLETGSLDDVIEPGREYIADQRIVPDFDLEEETPDSGNVNIFDFSIDGTTYQAEEGMTWAEWIDSSYNTQDNFKIENNNIYYDDLVIVYLDIILYENIQVASTDVIDSYQLYSMKEKCVLEGECEEI